MNMRPIPLLASLLLLAGPALAQTSDTSSGLDLDSMMKDMLKNQPGGTPAGSAPAQAPAETAPSDQPVPGSMPTFNLNTPPTPVPAEKPRGFVGKLVDNATFEVQAWGNYFLHDAESSSAYSRTFQGWSRVGVKSNARLGDNLLFNTEIRAITSTIPKGHQGIFSAPNDHGLRARYVDFDTLSLTWEQPDYSVLIGRSGLSRGLSTLFKPADRFHNSYGVEPPEGYDTGVWQARVDYFINDDTLSFAVAPFDNRSSVPHRTSRWLGSSGNYYFNSLDLPTGVNSVQNNFRKPTPDNWSYLVTYQGVRSGYDFFVLGNFGPSVYPVIREKPGSTVADAVEPRAGSVAAGVSATSGRWEVHGEGIYQMTFKNRDQDFLKYVLGVSYRETEFANSIGLNELNPVIEYAGEVVTNQQGASAAGYIQDSEASRPFRDAVLGRLDIRINSKWSGSVGGSYNFVDKDTSTALTAKYKYNDDLQFKADAEFYNGKSDTQFGRWRRNDTVRLGVVWNF